jgi:hypothetical protein
MLSLIICTRNPRPEYLNRCLAALEAQTLSREKWELILIDNASAPDRSPRPQLSWHPHARLLLESQIGLTPARLRGMREAKGDPVVFVDDDNVLDPDYLEQAVRVAQERPFLGCWSGQCRPEFEQQPPEWTRRYWGSLAIRQFDHDVWSNLPRLAETMPCGAGLCVRRVVVERYLQLHVDEKRLTVLDRLGDSLISGGRDDLAGCGCDLGLGIGLVTALKLTHLIPPQRLTESYLCRLIEGIEFSSAVLDAESGITFYPRSLSGMVADQLRMLRLTGPHRRIARAVLRGRLAAARLVCKARGLRHVCLAA